MEKVMTVKGNPGLLRKFHSIRNIPTAAKAPTYTLAIDPSVTNIFIVIDEDGGRASKSKMS
jgi:hypothetical protein